MKKNTFLHSGDLGDIIYSLPTIKRLGGGILYLNPASNSTVKDYPIKTKLSIAAINSLRPILAMQEYIDDVLIWNGENPDYNLDLFRSNIRFNNLAISHMDALGINEVKIENQWITYRNKRQLSKPYLINRSVRYHGNYVEWVKILNIIKDHSLFIGLPKEHEIFEYTFEVKIPYYPTPTIIDLVETINSCEKIFCNQSFAHAIAEGLAHPLHCEVFRPYPAAVFANKVTSQYF